MEKRKRKREKGRNIVKTHCMLREDESDGEEKTTKANAGRDNERSETDCSVLSRLNSTENCEDPRASDLSESICITSCAQVRRKKFLTNHEQLFSGSVIHFVSFSFSFSFSLFLLFFFFLLLSFSCTLSQSLCSFLSPCFLTALHLCETCSRYGD